jgi:hypothetical protein
MTMIMMKTAQCKSWRVAKSILLDHDEAMMMMMMLVRVVALSLVWRKQRETQMKSDLGFDLGVQQSQVEQTMMKKKKKRGPLCCQKKKEEEM